VFVGHAQYVCTECSANFRSPNPLKSHIMYHCDSPHRRPSPILDYTYSNWYSMLPLLLPPVTSSLPSTNYFRLMVESAMCQEEFQKSHDTEEKRLAKGRGHGLSLPFPPMTSSPLSAMYFRSPTGSPICPTKESRLPRGTDVQGRNQGQGKGQSTCWRPVCLDDVQSLDKEIDANSLPPDRKRRAPVAIATDAAETESISYGCGSVTVPRPSPSAANRLADTQRAEATTTGDRKRRGASVAETGSRYATSSRRETASRSVTSTSWRDGRHECPYCGKRYSRRYGLTIHVRTHTGHKPLQCAVCRRPFGDPSNLNKHVRLHAGDAGDTPYRCRHCGKVLVRRRDLERHVRSRHPDTAPSPIHPA